MAGTEGVHNGNSRNQRRDIYKMQWSVREMFPRKSIFPEFCNKKNLCKTSGVLLCKCFDLKLETMELG